MKTRLLSFIFAVSFLSTFPLGAQEGISFTSGWDEALSKAAAENKLLFVDCYTQWCGPCRNMDKNVFNLYSVGTFYNGNFVSVRVDAESEEGIPVAQQYDVRVYPTYLFIDPKTREVVHRSTSRQEPEVFIFTGESALDPVKRSPYLEQKFSEGETDPAFLLDYANYKGSVYDSKAALEICEKLLDVPGYGLDNARVWNLFHKNVKGVDNKAFKAMVASLDQMKALYGEKAVNEKLFAECQYLHELEKFADIPDFPGRKEIILIEQLNVAQRNGEYDVACTLADSVMTYNGPVFDKICTQLYYISRSDLYGEHPALWRQKCLEISRFVAYNNPDRTDENMHHNYAIHLEWALLNGGALSQEPAYGKKGYDLRPLDLKKKPVKKK
ncbi:MAG: thioredoxin family protein [Bacteroidales bacterium]|nr:thioredoxin family protein [Bacteroidales bacterium]